MCKILTLIVFIYRPHLLQFIAWCVSEKSANTVDSLYLELARDQKICSRQREFEIERETQVNAYTKGLRLQFEIEKSSRQRVFEIERVNCISNRVHAVFCTSETRHIQIFRNTRSGGRVNVTGSLDKIGSGKNIFHFKTF